MRRVATVLGWIALTGAGGIIPLGVLSWPPGGLMFALPFVFLRRVVTPPQYGGSVR